MRVPAKVDATWIATLGNEQLVDAESSLYTTFAKEESAEKRRAGARYTMLRGPESLVSAWLRWLLVSNEVRERGVVVHRREKRPS